MISPKPIGDIPVTNKQRFDRIAAILLFLVAIFGLLMYMGKGFTVRYAQDDYCYGYRLNKYGFLANQIDSYTNDTEYNGNRYSLTFSYNVIEGLGGPDFYPVVPALYILLWWVGISLILQKVLRRDKGRNLIWLSFGLAAVFVFFAIYLSPQQYQVFFWFSAQQTYFAPMVMFTIVLLMFFHFSDLEKIRGYHWILLGILTFYAGGFSESTTAWFLAVIGLLVIFSWAGKQPNFSSPKGRSLLLFIFGLTGCAAIALVISPSNAVSSRTEISPIFEALTISFKYGLDFLVDMFRVAPIPYSLLVVIGYLFAHLFNPNKVISIKNLLLMFLVNSVVLYLICVVVMFPTSYAMSAYAGPRALTPAHMSLLINLMTSGWLFERIQRKILPVFSEKPIYSIIISNVLGILLALYVGRAVYFENRDFALHQERAEAWDLREEMIISTVEDGTLDVTIPAFDSIYKITELTENPGHWVNKCAAQYYGAETIKAVENYQGIGIYPLGK
jgi:hypothetical protein